MSARRSWRGESRWGRTRRPLPVDRRAPGAVLAARALAGRDGTQDPLDDVGALVEGADGDALIDAVHAHEVVARGEVGPQPVHGNTSLPPWAGVGGRFVEGRGDDGPGVLPLDLPSERGIEICPGGRRGDPLALANARVHLGRALVVAADLDLDSPVGDRAPQFAHRPLARDAWQQSHVDGRFSAAGDHVRAETTL